MPVIRGDLNYCALVRGRSRQVMAGMRLIVHGRSRQVMAGMRLVVHGRSRQVMAVHAPGSNT